VKPGFLAATAAVTLALCACSGATDETSQQDAKPPVAATAPDAVAAATPAPATDKPMPEQPSLVIETFDGKTFDLSQHRGRWVVVNFWATWCNPCLKEIPDLAAMDASRDDIDVIGLAYEEIERADMEVFLKGRPIPYPIALVDPFGPPTDFGTPRGLPTTYLIDPQGRVAATHLGPVTSQDLLRDIAASKGKPAGG